MVKIGIIGSPGYPDMPQVETYVSGLKGEIEVYVRAGEGTDSSIRKLSAQAGRRSTRWNNVEELISAADGLVCFWDAEDQKVKAAAKAAKEQGKLIRVFGPSGRLIVSKGEPLDDAGKVLLFSGGFSPASSTYDRSEDTPVILDSDHRRVRRVTALVMNLYELNQHRWDTFANVLELILCTLERFKPGREERYMEVVKMMTPEAVRGVAAVFGELSDHFYKEGNFCDLLGPVYEGVASQWKKSGLGQYFTPWNVAVMMAQIVTSDLEDPTTREEPLTVGEPCVGSGVMMLAFKGTVAAKFGRHALRNVRIYGQDLDQVCVMMARIQMLLTDEWYMMNFYLAFCGEVLAARDRSCPGSSVSLDQ